MNLEEINLKQDINYKIETVFSVIDSLSKNRDSLVKTASSNLDQKINVNNKDINVNLTYKKLVTAQQNNTDSGLDLEEERLTIVSKEIKDPNYEAYVTKVAVTKDNQKIYMVSFFLRDLYLGRYLINRNLYFLKENHSKAKEAFNKFIATTKRVRNEYYAENLANIYIPKELQNYAIDQAGDFDFKNEDKLGTTVQRKHHNESTVYEWFRTNQEKLEEQRNFINELRGEE